MRTVIGILRTREQAQRAMDELAGAGIDRDALTLIASPTSAGELGQRGFGLSETAIRDLEAGVAQGQVVVRVNARDEADSARAEQVLCAHDAEHVATSSSVPAESPSRDGTGGYGSVGVAPGQGESGGGWWRYVLPAAGLLAVVGLLWWLSRAQTPGAKQGRKNVKRAREAAVSLASEAAARVHLPDVHLSDFQLSDLPLPEALTERVARVAQVTGRSSEEMALHLRRAAYVGRAAARDREGKSEGDR